MTNQNYRHTQQEIEDFFIPKVKRERTNKKEFVKGLTITLALIGIIGLILYFV